MEGFRSCTEDSVCPWNYLTKTCINSSNTSFNVADKSWYVKLI